MRTTLSYIVIDKIRFCHITMYVYAYGSKAVLIKRTFLLKGCGGLCWGGVGGVGWGGGVNVLSSAYSTYFYAPEISGMLATLHVATLPRSLECLPRYMFSTLPRALECLPRYMLLRCRDLWNACHVTCCYAAEISGMLATLHVATLLRALECLPRYMLLRCRDLWNACHVTCCYAAEISGMLATLHVATLLRALECLPRNMLLHSRDLWNACHVTCSLRCRDLWNACHVTCCYAAESSGMLATLHVATLLRALECLPRYMLLRC